jgi:hypothetical protein
MNPVVHVLTLMLATGAAQAEPIDLGRYTTAAECEMLARSVKVHQAGARITCIRQPMTPQERLAWALLVGGRP